MYIRKIGRQICLKLLLIVYQKNFSDSVYLKINYIFIVFFKKVIPVKHFILEILMLFI